MLKVWTPSLNAAGDTARGRHLPAELDDAEGHRLQSTAWGMVLNEEAGRSIRRRRWMAALDDGVGQQNLSLYGAMANNNGWWSILNAMLYFSRTSGNPDNPGHNCHTLHDLHISFSKFQRNQQSINIPNSLRIMQYGLLLRSMRFTYLVIPYWIK